MLSNNGNLQTLIVTMIAGIAPNMRFNQRLLFIYFACNVACGLSLTPVQIGKYAATKLRPSHESNDIIALLVRSRRSQITLTRSSTDLNACLNALHSETARIVSRFFSGVASIEDVPHNLKLLALSPRSCATDHLFFGPFIGTAPMPQAYPRRRRDERGEADEAPSSA